MLNILSERILHVFPGGDNDDLGLGSRDCPTGDIIVSLQHQWVSGSNSTKVNSGIRSQVLKVLASHRYRIHASVMPCKTTIDVGTP